MDIPSYIKQLKDQNNPPIEKIDLFMPHLTELMIILEEGMKNHFKKVRIEWVDCPDLTEHPFYFSAPGFGGDTALMNIGGMSSLFPHPLVQQTYDFKNLLKKIDRNLSNTFIIGAGSCLRSNQQISDLFMDASFLPSDNGTMEVINYSNATFINEKTNECKMEKLTDSDITCSMQGNFFLSEGRPGGVIKVYAKEHYTTVDYIDVIQETLVNKYSWLLHLCNPSFIGLGGVFLMTKGKARHHIFPPSWEARLQTKEDILNWIRFYDIDEALKALGTIVSLNHSSIFYKTDNLIQNFEPSHFHTLSNERRGGHYYKEIKQQNSSAEYLGYFCLASKLYNINAANRHLKLLNLRQLL